MSAAAVCEMGSSKTIPCSSAKSRAPSPTSITWAVFSITSRARRIGFFTSVRQPTAPAPPACPRITDASVSTLPRRLSADPTPALNVGSSSRQITAASTAPSALPPDARRPAATASRRPAPPGPWRRSFAYVAIRRARGGQGVRHRGPTASTFAEPRVALLGGGRPRR